VGRGKHQSRCLDTVAATLAPLIEAIRAHVFAAERIHADDTAVPARQEQDADGKALDGSLEATSRGRRQGHPVRRQPAFGRKDELTILLHPDAPFWNVEG
jgi:transposase